MAESGSEEEFEDAPTHFQQNSGDIIPVDHTTGLAAIQMAVDLMNDNKYFEAEAMLKPMTDTSIYHSTAHGTILFLQAVMSFEQESIELATTALNDAVELCHSQRKVKGVLEAISGWMFGQKLDGYTLAELQAEIFYAENNLLLSFVTFLQDESLVSFIKGGLRIRSCFSLYKQLYAWLETCEQEEREVDTDFAAGVRMGIGCFNLFLSLLPGRVLRLLEFVGFSGNRELGLEQLTRGAESGTFRANLCSSFLLFYHSVATVLLGLSDMNTACAEGLLRPQLEKYPNSPLFLFFKGRVELMKGDVNQAGTCFQQVVDTHTQWVQVHHLCWWELMWCHCYKAEWEVAATFADKLYQHSKCLKECIPEAVDEHATTLYQRAAFLLMLRNTEQGQSNEIVSGVTLDDIAEMMKQIPPLKRRYAGKSLPIEKLAVAKSERFLQGARIPLAPLEMMYAWNGYRILGMNPPLLHNILRCVWTELMTLEATKDDNPFYVDDWCVVSLMQGVCFKDLKRYDEAEQCFLGILERSPRVQHDHYAVAAASLELGLLYLEMGNIAEAERRLETTRTSYKGYHLESRIHFRIHAGLYKVAQLKAAAL